MKGTVEVPEAHKQPEAPEPEPQIPRPAGSQGPAAHPHPDRPHLPQQPPLGTPGQAVLGWGLTLCPHQAPFISLSSLGPACWCEAAHL